MVKLTMSSGLYDWMLIVSSAPKPINARAAPTRWVMLFNFHLVPTLPRGNEVEIN